MPDTIKVDWDNKDWVKYKKLFKFRYETLLSYNMIEIEKGEVYKTKHGYHIYYDVYWIVDDNERWIMEALLGDDINRMLYNYCESEDILFNYKNGYEVKLDKTKTQSLQKLINNINNNPIKRQVIKGVLTDLVSKGE